MHNCHNCCARIFSRIYIGVVGTIRSAWFGEYFFLYMYVHGFTFIGGVVLS